MSTFARTLVAATRSWALYPPEHPAVATSLANFQTSLTAAARSGGLSIDVTPDTLLVAGTPMAGQERLISDAAALLHDRDVLSLSIVSDVPSSAVRALLSLLVQDAEQVRTRGGPAHAWIESGHPSIAIEQIDYKKVLEDREDAQPASERDDLWRAIVQGIVRRQATFDEAAQARLLGIAGDPMAISELAEDVMAPSCSADGSPMITSQAAAVLAAYRHLTSIVSVLAPERKDEVMRNITNATTTLDPKVIMQLLKSEDQAPGGGVSIVRGIADGFDDVKVAELLAMALSLEGRASDRLAEVFNTIAPDEARKRRVLKLARNLLSATDFGKKDQFDTLWTSTEDLLVTYNDKAFVSDSYRAALDGASERASAMAADLPPELPEWLETLEQESVRRLSVTLLTDLFQLEQDPVRATEVLADLGLLAEDLVMAGDFEATLEVVRTLSRSARNAKTKVHAGARNALDTLGGSASLRDAVSLLSDLDDAQFARFRSVCTEIGPASARALERALDCEATTPARTRATELIVSFGPAAIRWLTPPREHNQWYAQRNVAAVLGRIGAPEGVPLLQPLLRGADSRTMVEAVRALANINDPSAARAVHTAMRAAGGDHRQAVVTALVAERDSRAVPLLIRILQESQPLGPDHAVVLETVQALAELGDDRAVAPIASLLRVRKWLARAKTTSLKTAAVVALGKIGSSAAQAALRAARDSGDRTTRRLVQAVILPSPQPGAPTRSDRVGWRPSPRKRGEGAETQ